jgi:hypothetical protein
VRCAFFSRSLPVGVWEREGSVTDATIRLRYIHLFLLVYGLLIILSTFDCWADSAVVTWRGIKFLKDSVTWLRNIIFGFNNVLSIWNNYGKHIQREGVSRWSLEENATKSTFPPLYPIPLCILGQTPLFRPLISSNNSTCVLPINHPRLKSDRSPK